MSYTYLLEQGEESSAASFSDIPRYVLSRLNLTAEKSYCKGSGTASCQSSQSGMMSPPSTEPRGGEKSMSSAGVSLAKTSQSQGGGLELKASEANSGQKWPESFVKWHPATSSWKTRQCSLLEGLDEFSETWPRWGMMRGGECWELSTPGRRTSENESGSWPTPNASDNRPRATAASTERRRKLGKQISLEAAVKYPTPKSRDWKDTGTVPPSRVLDLGKDTLGQRVARTEPGGSLNPTWVEWLMGWPIEWTSLQPLATARFQAWLHSHGEFLEVEND
jgi:hypothetical protein